MRTSEPEPPSPAASKIFFKIFIQCIWLGWVLVVAHGNFHLHCIMWDLVPWSGMESKLLAFELTTPVFLPGKSHGQRSLVGYSPRGHKELDTVEQLSTHSWACAHTHTRTHTYIHTYTHIHTHTPQDGKRGKKEKECIHWKTDNQKDL